MRCVICGQDKMAFCLCGYCTDCIKRFTHEGCWELIKDRRKDGLDKSLSRD